eukprot:TRINITY_DN21113_c0_g1_i5.p2 TRINITY_DN21113_c0_g1~~TRINITY_DN21113_c0_g1_i5.p2  ORF type:complete len:106 (+),score=18.44 TRINITY_DN21113_c0_g1_i5:424-741(+)
MISMLPLGAGKLTPKFCKPYGSIHCHIERALVSYRDEVKASTFPSQQHAPYKMSAKQLRQFLQLTSRSNVGGNLVHGGAGSRCHPSPELELEGQDEVPEVVYDLY